MPGCRSPIARAQRAFTLVELLVVIAIIGAMAALLLPGLQAMRETARRATCQANLSRLVAALHGYHEVHGALPPGVTDTQHPIQSLPNGRHHGWLIHVLPQLDEGPAFKAVDWESSVYDPKNEPVALARPESLACPTRPEPNFTATDYAGCHHDVEAPIDADNHGVLFLNSRITLEEITDGRAHTLFVAEKPTASDDSNWLSGTRGSLRNTGWPTVGPTLAQTPAVKDVQPPIPPAAGAGLASAPSPLYVGPFGGFHSGGVLMAAFGDGAVHPIEDEIDAKLFRRLGNRADGELTPPVSKW